MERYRHLFMVLCALILIWTGCSVVNNEDPYTAVLKPGASGNWDDYSVGDPFVYYDNGDSKYKMYYAGCRSDQVYKIGYAESPDGIVWTKPNLGAGNNICISAGFATWANNGVVSPVMVKSATNAFHMYLIGIDDNGVYRAGYASSSDGLSWTPQTVAVLNPSGIGSTFDEKSIRDIFVRLDGSTYQVWYTGKDAGGLCRMGYTTTITANVITRVTAPIPGLDPASYYTGGLFAPHVYFDVGASKYRMWPTSLGGRLAITYGQYSSPGASWTLVTAPVLEESDDGFDDYQVGMCAVIKDPVGSGYIMWYTGFSSDGLAIGRATSGNGHDWDKYRAE